MIIYAFPICGWIQCYLYTYLYTNEFLLFNFLFIMSLLFNILRVLFILCITLSSKLVDNKGILDFVPETSSELDAFKSTDVNFQETGEIKSNLKNTIQNATIKNRYRPVLILHGIMSGNRTLKSFKERIQMTHPGTKIVIPNNYSHWASLEPMWNQVLEFGELMMQMSEEYPDGINLIGYSQGGLIARCILEQFPNHNVKTFISLSAPQGGQYGTKFLHTIFPELVRETAYELFYSTMGQHISVGNFWNDPHHQHLFFKYSTFLPFVNNINNTLNSYLFKQGLLRLREMILIGGPNDSVITPWQSSQFGHFTKNESVVELQDTEGYKQDSLGLRTLDMQGKLKLISVPGVDHFQWHENLNVIDTHVIPYLD